MVDLSCIVLAGGKSTRMGSDKRVLKIGGRNFLEIAFENAGRISEDVVVSLGYEGQSNQDFKDATVVFDDLKERGPLFALKTALSSCKSKYTAILPLDAPMLNIKIYARMLEEIKGHSDVDGVIPESYKGAEPLYGVYRTESFLSATRKATENGFQRVQDAINLLETVVRLDIEKFRGVDPKLLSFHNVNTPFDLERLMETIDG